MGIRVILQIFILQRRNDVLVSFDSQAKLFDRIMQNVGENFRIRLVAGVSWKSPGFEIRSDRNKGENCKVIIDE